MFRKPFLRKTSTKAAGSDRACPRRKALVVEKSQASWPPLGPRGTQTSAGRREGEEGSEGSGLGGTVIVRGVTRDEEPRLLQDRAKAYPVIGGRMDNISDQVVAGHPITTAPAHEGVVAPFVHDLAAKSAVGVLGPNGHAETAT